MSKRVKLPLAEDLSGKRYWRSLGELNGSPEFTEKLPAEFPENAWQPPEGQSRRTFLTVMGASMALGGLAGCRRPEEKILPYTRSPEELVPGNPLFFATAMPFMGTAFGVLVESNEGRPTKIEGNPKHPESLGSTNTFGQAWVLDLYDPDRSDTPRQKGQAKSWEEVSSFLRSEGDRLKATGGKGLAVLTESHRSPTLQGRLQALKEAMPGARVVRYEPFSRDNVREGARLAFGRPLEMTLDLAQAKVIVALDADILMTEGSPIKQARTFVKGRDVDAGQDAAANMNRLYAVESCFTITGVNADHRLRMQSRDIPAFTFALAAELGRKHNVALGDEVLAAAEAKAQGLSPKAQKFVAAIAKDLASNRGRGAVAAGRGQPAAVHAVVHIINQALDNAGKGARYVPAFDEGRDGASAIVELAQAMSQGQIETLIILGGNPVFDAPADAKFADALAKVPTSVHVASYVDETGEKTTWHINQAHPLESWGDVRAEDGTASIIQPLIAPLHGGKTDAEVVDRLLGGMGSDYDLVRATWRAGKSDADFERAWRRALHDGILADTAAAPEAVTPAPGDVAKAVQALAAPAKDGMEVTFRPDWHAWDGRFANNGWMQELPEAMSKTAWGNVAAISPATASKLGVQDGELVTVSGAGGSVTLPVIVSPGHADDSIGLTVGQGRRAALRVAAGIGTDTYPLRASAAYDVAGGFAIARGGSKVPIDTYSGWSGRQKLGEEELARTQEHFSMEGRAVARDGSLADYQKDPEFAKKMSIETPLFSLFEEPNRALQQAWGMAIDLNSCIGCNACVVACQSENNIPVVGSDGVRRSREMHWLRIDRYFEGTAADEPESISQPMTCQHCENAPCEQVCPVAATTHSPEGINEMAYNRCIGTRYCANNCPFKVRRFNFLEYSGWAQDEHRRLQQNPEVTVRTRGVMEKCTFCVQRVNRAKIEAKRDGKERVEDGKVVTACQAACPTQAIWFGDLNDPKSAVTAKAASPRSYRLLEELNVKTRINYLAKIRNRNPELEGA